MFQWHPTVPILQKEQIIFLNRHSSGISSTADIIELVTKKFSNPLMIGPPYIV